MTCRHLLLFPVAALLLANTRFRTLAGDGCGRCGADSCRTVCRLICEKKTVEIPCFRSRCELICRGGPCRKGCKQCESVCDGCGKEGCTHCGASATGGGKRFVYQETIPGCPKQYRRKVLLMKKQKKTVTVYRWVVEELCGACESNASAPVVPREARIPEPPDVPGAIVQPPRLEPVRVRKVR